MKIKRCPFCKKKDTLEIMTDHYIAYRQDEDKENYQVVCAAGLAEPGEEWRTGCGASSGFWETEEQAITAWNRRRRWKKRSYAKIAEFTKMT